MKMRTSKFWSPADTINEPISREGIRYSSVSVYMPGNLPSKTGIQVAVCFPTNRYVAKSKRSCTAFSSEDAWSPFKLSVTSCVANTTPEKYFLISRAIMVSWRTQSAYCALRIWCDSSTTTMLWMISRSEICCASCSAFIRLPTRTQWSQYSIRALYRIPEQIAGSSFNTVAMLKHNNCTWLIFRILVCPSSRLP